MIELPYGINGFYLHRHKNNRHRFQKERVFCSRIWELDARWILGHHLKSLWCTSAVSKPRPKRFQRKIWQNLGWQTARHEQMWSTICNQYGNLPQ